MNELIFAQNKHQKNGLPETSRGLQICGLRGAITVEQNSAEAITEAVNELLNALETKNAFNPAQIISAIFSVTPDLNAMFPAAAARGRFGWKQIPLLDVQHMKVVGSLEYCIRVLIYLNTPLHQESLRPVYLRRAVKLRPEFANTGDYSRS